MGGRLTSHNHNPQNTHMKATYQTNNEDYEPAQIALALHLDCDPADLTEERHKHYGALTVYSLGGQEYAIGTNDEADRAWDAALDSYLEDCVYPELPKNLANYFDDEKWKSDARYDGRGHSLSPYDGNEDEVDYEGETFFVYRIN